MRERNRLWVALMALAVVCGRAEHYQEQKILSPVPGVMFARPLSVDGNTAVTIRAEAWDKESASEVVIMERGLSGWTITQTFTNDYPHVWRQFEVHGDEIFAQHEARIDIYDYQRGYFTTGTFSVSGDRLALFGTYYREMPRIHLFKRVAGKWVKDGEMPPVDNGTYFQAMALQGNRILVSTVKIVSNQQQRRAYVYELRDTQTRQMIEPPFEQEGAVFGGQVALRGNWALINYHNVSFTNGTGAIYAYRYNGEAWE